MYINNIAQLVKTGIREKIKLSTPVKVVTLHLVVSFCKLTSANSTLNNSIWSLDDSSRVNNASRFLFLLSKRGVDISATSPHNFKNVDNFRADYVNSISEESPVLPFNLKSGKRALSFPSILVHRVA